MSRLLILYASQTETGRVRQLVDTAVAGAAQEPAVRCTVCRADQADATTLLDASGLLIITPEHFGYMAGKLKDFFDRTYYPLEGRTVGLPYALWVCAGNDGSGTVRAVERIVAGYRWRAVAPPRIVVGDPDPASLMAVRESALALATGIALGAF